MKQKYFYRFLLALAATLFPPLANYAKNFPSRESSGSDQETIQEKTVYFYCDFENGIPGDFKLYNLDYQPFHFTMIQYGFKNGDSWILKYSDKNYFAASSSKYELQAGTVLRPADDWIITPAVKIKARDALLSWKAKAVCENSKSGDGYKVLLSTSGNRPEDFKEAPIYTIGEETRNQWSEHLVNLGEYVGKSVYIAFVNNSFDREVLAIDDIKVEGGKGLCELTVNTKEHVYDTDRVNIQCCITAYSETSITDITGYCRYGSKTYKKQIANLHLTKYKSTDFTFDESIPISLGDTVKYRIWADVNGERLDTIDHYTVSFAFKPTRKIVAEEGTGMWCGYCPRGIFALETLKEKYPGEFIGISLHDNDPLEMTDYIEAIAFEGYPSGIVNRKFRNIDPAIVITENGKKKLSTLNGGLETFFLKAKEEITLADVKLNCKYAGGKIKTTTSVRFAVNFEHVDFRLAFVLKENNVTGNGFYQINNYSDGSIEEAGGYEHLPYRITNPVFNDIARSILPSFSGIPGSIPQRITAKNPYQFDYQFEFPKNVDKLDQTEVIALLIDHQSGEIVNADCFNMSSIISGIAPELADDPYTVECHVQDRYCLVTLTSPVETKATVTLYTLDGQLVSSVEQLVINRSTLSLPTPVGSGIYFVSVKFPGANKTITRKVVL